MSDPHREYCRRQHRIIEHFLALQSWIRQLDCIVLERRHLEAFLDLKRFKSIRVKWLEDDLKPWFQFQQPYYQTGAASSIHSLFLSRIPISNFLSDKSMTSENRILQLKPGAPKTGMYSKYYDWSEIPSEEQIISYLATLASGLRTPKKILKREKKQSF